MTLNTAQPHYQTLGQFDPDAALRQGTAITHPEELIAAYSRIEELERALGEARLQLEYLHEKFQPTGTTEATLAGIDRVLA